MSSIKLGKMIPLGNDFKPTSEEISFYIGKLKLPSDYSREFCFTIDEIDAAARRAAMISRKEFKCLRDDK